MRKLFRLAAYLLTAYLARVLATRDPRHRVAAKESDTNESRRPIGYRTPTEPVEHSLLYCFVEPPAVGVECRR